MEKVNVKAKKGQNPDDAIKQEMEKYTSQGYVIKAAGYDWFMYDKPVIKQSTNKRNQQTVLQF